jgi:RNA polymerase subunit RPABC4/transcription elongation factor Spt4
MGSSRREGLCTSCGWTGTNHIDMCPECGSHDLADLAGGALVRVPPGYDPCARCGRTDHPLIFRGSVRLAGLIWIAREKRTAGYFCEACARKTAARSLAYTGLLGWWGFLSFLVYAPRATYHNWRAVWRAPRKPLAWGATEAAPLAEQLRAARPHRWSGFEGASDAQQAEL